MCAVACQADTGTVSRFSFVCGFFLCKLVCVGYFESERVTKGSLTNRRSLDCCTHEKNKNVSTKAERMQLIPVWMWCVGEWVCVLFIYQCVAWRANWKRASCGTDNALARHEKIKKQKKPSLLLNICTNVKSWKRLCLLENLDSVFRQVEL